MEYGTEGFYSVKAFGAYGDGRTDDTAAIQACLDEAQRQGGTAYFPPATYLIEGTLYFGDRAGVCGNAFSVQGMGQGNSRSILKKRNAGNIAEINTTGKVSVSQLGFSHEGPSGSNLLMNVGFGHGVYDCQFSHVTGNKDDMLQFNGSYIDLVNSSFGNAEPDSYAIRCTTMPGKININSNIFDCRIHGTGKGLIVDSSKGNRPEGLKVSRNMFLNVGKEQLTVKTILHLDISNNMLDQCSGASILLDPEDQALCGVYILGNYISPAQDRDQGIAIKIVDNGLLTLTTNIANNMIAYSGYGLIAGSNAVHLNVSNNAFNDITHDAVVMHNCRGAVLTSNTFWMCAEHDIVSDYTDSRTAEAPVIANNQTGRM